MRKALMALVVVLALAIAGCAAQQPLNTPNGRPEVVFLNSSIEDTRGRLAGGCSRKGIPVIDMGSNHVTCGKTMSGKDAFLAQMLVGNSYSTAAMRKVQFFMYQDASDVNVTAREWIESQMVGGQVNQRELNSTQQMQGLQDFLISIGGSSR